MPSAVVVVGIDRVADAALDVDPDHHRIDERTPSRTEVLGERQRRRRDRAGGMDDRPQVRIVEIERVRGDSVEERRARDVHALAAAQQARLGAGSELVHRRERGIYRRMARCADRTADPVQERPMGLALDAFVPSSRRMRRDEVRENARDRRRLSRRWQCRHGHGK